MKHLNKFLLAIVASVGTLFTACNDDDNNMSRAVLASVDVLEFEVKPLDCQRIIVTSDADWVAEFPEWISVSPASGHAGQTEVIISVPDNVRDGVDDNPRRGDILFKGRNLESIATVIVRQSGDKYRDPVDYTIESAFEMPDETIVRLPDLTVAAITAKGYVLTNLTGTKAGGEGNVYVPIADDVQSKDKVEVGDKVNVVGEKLSDDMGLPYINGGKINLATGTASLALSAADITETLDNITLAPYAYVSVTGNYDDIMNTVAVKGMANQAYVVDAAENLDFSALGGHKITVNGFYAGSASPVVRIIPLSVEDHGFNEVVYFFDDFEWLDPWCDVKNVHDYVAMSETIAAESTNLNTALSDGRTVMDELTARGYDFVKATFEGKEDRPFATRIYIQRNYLKFSLTGIEAGLVLPKLENIPAGEELELCFNWSPMRQGNPGAANRKYDDINLVVIVSNSAGTKQIPVPPHTLKAGATHEWMNATISLAGLEIDANTTITIRSSDDKWPTDKVNRWFIDNVKVRQAL